MRRESEREPQRQTTDLGAKLVPKAFCAGNPAFWGVFPPNPPPNAIEQENRLPASCASMLTMQANRGFIAGI